MSEFQKSTFQVLVGNSYDPDGNAPYADLNDFLATGNDGELKLFMEDGSSILSAGKFFAVLKNSKEAAGFIRSELIDPTKLASGRFKNYVAGTNQVSVIGYNPLPVTPFGSIDTPAGGAGLLYQANFMIPEYGSYSANDFAIRQGHYQAAAADGQVEVANGLTQSIVWNMSRDVDTIMRPHRVTNSTITAIGTGAIDAKLGQKVVTITTALATAATAGDYLGLTVSVNGTNVKTFYRVVSTTGNTAGDTITLDVEFQGPTAPYAAASIDLVTAANAASGDWGIVLVGGEKKFLLGKMELTKMKFTTTLIDMGATTLTDKATVASIGNGDGRRMQELEWAAQGNERDLYRMGEPYLFDEVINAVATSTYGVGSLSYYTETETEFVNTRSPRQLYISVPVADQTDLSNDLATVGVL